MASAVGAARGPRRARFTVTRSKPSLCNALQKASGTKLDEDSWHASSSDRRRQVARCPDPSGGARRIARASSLIAPQRVDRVAERNRRRALARQLREPTHEVANTPQRANKMTARFSVAISRPHRDQGVRPDYDLSSSIDSHPRATDQAGTLSNGRASPGSLCRCEGHVSRSRRLGACRRVATLADELPSRHLRRLRRTAIYCRIARSCGAT